MTKRIKLIQDLYSKANMSDKGIAVVRGRINWNCGQSELMEKYRIEIKGDRVSLFHWERHTLEYDTTNNEILYHYGQSNSDRDSLNTLLAELGHCWNEYFRYAPTKQGFYLYDELANV